MSFPSLFGFSTTVCHMPQLCGRQMRFSFCMMILRDIVPCSVVLSQQFYRRDCW